MTDPAPRALVEAARLVATLANAHPGLRGKVLGDALPDYHHPAWIARPGEATVDVRCDERGAHLATLHLRAHDDLGTRFIAELPHGPGTPSKIAIILVRAPDDHRLDLGLEDLADPGKRPLERVQQVHLRGGARWANAFAAEVERQAHATDDDRSAARKLATLVGNVARRATEPTPATVVRYSGRTRRFNMPLETIDDREELLARVLSAPPDELGSAHRELPLGWSVAWGDSRSDHPETPTLNIAPPENRGDARVLGIVVTPRETVVRFGGETAHASAADAAKAALADPDTRWSDPTGTWPAVLGLATLAGRRPPPPGTSPWLTRRITLVRYAAELATVTVTTARVAGREAVRAAPAVPGPDHAWERHRMTDTWVREASDDTGPIIVPRELRDPLPFGSRTG